MGESLSLDKALQILDQDGVVGIPTETVYGLAARIDRPQGIKKIFTTKGRPLFDPLIVHVSDLAMAKKYCRTFPEIAETLAHHFWPGPLTLILPKTDSVPDLVTAGLTTVGLRVPKSQETLELIRKVGVGLPAPSANRFGRTSPSTWEHVESEFQGQVFVLKGPAAEVGIESTIIEVKGTDLILHRPGMISVQDLDSVLKAKGLSYQWIDRNNQGVQAPGQMRRHYMPEVPLVSFSTRLPEPELVTQFLAGLGQVPEEMDGVKIQRPVKISKLSELVLPEDPFLAARVLYKELRRLSQSCDLIYFQERDYMLTQSWAPVFERLTKATLIKLN